MVQKCQPETTLHATTVAFEGRGVIILGETGSGKSALALELMAIGADLVADDRTIVRVGDQGRLIASCPEPISGHIEARFVGILRARPCSPVPLELAIDLNRVEDRRLPLKCKWLHLGVILPKLNRVDQRYFPAAIRQYLLSGRDE